MVSPPDKMGGDVTGDSANTHAAENGDAVVFSSLTGFGNLQGMPGDVQYLSQRNPAAGGNGWVTTAITPREKALSLQQVISGQLPGFEAMFTPDLSSGIYRTWTSLVDAPNVAETANLYLEGGFRAGNETIQLLTNSALPVPANARLRPVFAGASVDLTHVIFESRAQLTPDAGTSMNLYESVNGNVRLAAILPDGSAAPASSTGPFTTAGFYPSHMISSDGRRVFFTDRTTGNIYMRQDGLTTEQLNASEKAVREAPQGATLVTASTDGTRAFFITSEGIVNGDDDGAPDLYMYDAAAPAGSRLTRLSVDNEPADGGGVQTVLGASDDGHYVYFVADGQLVAGEPLPAPGPGLYLWHDGSVRYIGAFADGTEAFRNSPQTRYIFWTETNSARVSPDGRHLLFMTRSDAGFRGREGFPGYDHGSTCTFDSTSGGPCRELYLYSADTNRLVCTSCDPGGSPGTSDALLNERVGTGPSAPNWHLSHALSDDGRYVFFNTGQALVPQDVNGKVDAYEYDVETGAVHLISSGRDSADSYFLDASPSGDDVFFITREQFVGWDTDGNYDLYDARVNGGMPEPLRPAAPCGGDGCHGQPAGPIGMPELASSGFAGAGNVTARLRAHRRAIHRRCRLSVRTGKRSREVRRCVRRSTRKHVRRAVVVRQRRSK